MRLHIGCGSVYLRDWVNVDLPFPNVFLAADRPDLVESLGTDEEDYYGRHGKKTIETLRQPIFQEMVCDRYGAFEFLPVAPQSVDEILTRQCFEHLSIAEAHRALDRMKAVLKPAGFLRIDVPDHDETFRKLIETGDSFFARHLMGPRSNDRGYHMMSYTREALKKLVESHGFCFPQEEPNIHLYPAICMRFQLWSA